MKEKKAPIDAKIAEKNLQSKAIAYDEKLISGDYLMHVDQYQYFSTTWGGQ